MKKNRKASSRKLLSTAIAASLMVTLPFQAQAAVSVSTALSVVQQATADAVIGNGTVYYVSPNGSDSNNGTSLTSPFKTVNKAVASVKAGDTIYVRGGTYQLTSAVNPKVSGTSGNPITLANYKNEKVTLDGSKAGSEGTKVLRFSNIAYWNVSGINVMKAQGIAIGIQDNSHHIRIANLDTHHNRGTGLGFENGASNNTVVNVNSYFNYDDQAGGENADGFASKHGSHHNTFINCQAWNNSDDGWDFWEATDNVIAGSASFNNGLKAPGQPWTSSSDGNGYKLGGSKSGKKSGDNLVINSVAYNNHSRGFDWNAASLKNTLYNTTAYNNKTNYRMQNSGDVIRNSISAGTGTVSLAASVDDKNNSWNLNVSNPQFSSTDPSSASFLRLSSSSPLVDKGANVGLPYAGQAPDIGAYEVSAAAPAPKPAPAPTPAPKPAPAPAPADDVLDLKKFAAEWDIKEQATAVKMLHSLIERELGINVHDASMTVTPPSYKANAKGKLVDLDEFVKSWTVKDKKEAVRMMHNMIEKKFNINVTDATMQFRVPTFKQ
jgi:hypothetical protein